MLERHVRSKLPDAEPSRYGRQLRRLREELGVSGTREVFLASAPGRTELAGNHTDHNHGRVLAASVQLDTIAAVAPRTDKRVRLSSEGYPPLSVDLDDKDARPAERETTAALVRGVAAALAGNGRALGGFDAAVSSTVAAGSGLSSSASIEVLLGAILSHGWNDSSIGTTEIAIAGKRAENIYFGKPSGLMDQIACAAGGIVSIDFADSESPQIKRVSARFDDLGLALLVVETGSGHADLTSDYSAIPEEMGAVARELGREVLGECSEHDLISNLRKVRSVAGDRAVARALHFFRENARVELMYEALERGDTSEYLALMAESGRSSAIYLQNVASAGTAREQAVVIALALTERYMIGAGLTPGVHAACRVHGGGFAGTIQVLLPADQVESYRSAIEPLLGPVTRLAVRSVGSVAW